MQQPKNSKGVKEEELKRSESFFRAIFRENRDAILIADTATGTILDANEQALRLIGRPREELIGRDRAILHPPGEAEHYQEQFLRHIGMNHAEPEESEIVTAKGQRVTVEISASTVTLPDGRQVIVGNFRDITERKKAEEKRLSDIGRLAATVAHELRNPLGVIKVAAYNIRRKKKGTTLDGHLEVIDKKISESDQIIQNLLFYARTKAPRFERVAVIDILDTSLGHCRDRYAGWDVDIKRMLDLEERYFIEADDLQLAELFANILDNAYHAFSDKKGAIEIALGYGGNDRLHITVSDNGCGIKEAELSKVFEPFFTNRVKGVGLGLTVCKQVVEAHGGRIDIKSEAGKGTTVTVDLPVGGRL